MFENDIGHKGLFTFYRQQADFQYKFTKQFKVQKKNNKSIKLKENPKHKSNRFSIVKNNIIEKDNQSNINLTAKISPSKSFQQINKEYVKKLSSRNQCSFQLNSKQIGSQVVVILKGSKTKQDLKLNKLNLKYQMQDGYFLKQKIFDPLQQPSSFLDQQTQSQQNNQQLIQIRKPIKRNHSLNDRYGHSRSQLENQLLVNNKKKVSRQAGNLTSFERVNKVNMRPQIPQFDKSFESNYNNSKHLMHKRIPPKVLASILKSENNEIIKHLRRQIQKQKQQQRKNQVISRHHSFIQYGNFDYQKRQLDINKLNQKQRRMINILNKFSKRV